MVQPIFWEISFDSKSEFVGVWALKVLGSCYILC